MRRFATRRRLPRDMPDLRHFLLGGGSPAALPAVVDVGRALDLPPLAASSSSDEESQAEQGGGRRRRSVFIETYGCAMNVSDTEIMRGVLRGADYALAETDAEADVVILNTCAIRDRAEQKIHSRLGDLKKRKMERQRDLIVGVVGCMAERLKADLLEKDKLVDLVIGPDGYKTLPQVLKVVEGGEGRKAINTMLSADETYADVAPVRVASNKVTSYISIARGCNNMCSFCIVVSSFVVRSSPSMRC